MNITLRQLGVLLAALAVGSVASAADNTEKKGYLVDSNKSVVRSGFGLCWQTGTWSPADAIEECDGDIAKPAATTLQPDSAPPQAPASAPAPAPTAAASEPAAAAEPAAAYEPAAASEPAAAAAAPAAADAPTSEKVSFAADAFFDFDKAVLKPEGKARLEDLVSKLQGTDIEVIVATGHTDWTGSDAYNQKLSERRARAVKAFLVSKGIPEARVFTEGKGERSPVADNRSRDGRAKNRRVEVEVVGKRNP
jgi:OOP family OmpA-OmpF porin